MEVDSRSLLYLIGLQFFSHLFERTSSVCVCRLTPSHDASVPWNITHVTDVKTEWTFSLWEKQDMLLTYCVIRFLCFDMAWNGSNGNSPRAGRRWPHASCDLAEVWPRQDRQGLASAHGPALKETGWMTAIRQCSRLHGVSCSAAF